MRAHRLIIEPYMGYGTPTRLMLSGRILQDNGLIRATPTDSKWRNLRNSFRRFATREVSNVRVRARYRDFETVAASDVEGYFQAGLDLPEPVAAAAWETVALELHETEGAAAEPAPADVLVPPSSARFGVVS